MRILRMQSILQSLVRAAQVWGTSRCVLIAVQSCLG